MNYQKKYLKYKSKYLQLKGGMEIIDDHLVEHDEAGLDDPAELEDRVAVLETTLVDRVTNLEKRVFETHGHRDKGTTPRGSMPGPY